MGTIFAIITYSGIVFSQVPVESYESCQSVLFIQMQTIAYEYTMNPEFRKNFSDASYFELYCSGIPMEIDA